MEGISHEDILRKQQDLNVLHKKIAADKENLSILQKQNRDLLLQIDFMKRMQLSADQERDKFVVHKNIFAQTDKRISALSQLKLRRFQSMESISFIKHEGATEQRNQDPIHELLKEGDIVPGQAHEQTTQWPGNEQGERSGEGQLQLARELVKKNRQIFELEQVGYHSNTHHVLCTKHSRTPFELQCTCTSCWRSLNDTYLCKQMAPAS